jgi:hypothetical protein
VTAFYDDSGGFAPGGGNFACLGMVVVPASRIRECGEAWWEMLGGHFQFAGSLQTNGIEAKSSELYSMAKLLDGKRQLNLTQQNMFDHGLDTASKVNNLIEAIWDFIAKPQIMVRYLAVVANKERAWEEFRNAQFGSWKILNELPRNQQEGIKPLRKELASFLVRHAHVFLLQRLEYLSKDQDFGFTDAFVVGDESSDTKDMLQAQAAVQAGLGKFTELPSLVNRSWFGNSLYDPCLQIADWVAFAVRTWAELKPMCSSRINQLLPHFRGYPNEVLGRGIVLCPNAEGFPNLPP